MHLFLFGESSSTFVLFGSSVVLILFAPVLFSTHPSFEVLSVDWAFRLRYSVNDNWQRRERERKSEFRDKQN